jgi:tetratricopeptide (TPR) repeat protein
MSGQIHRMQARNNDTLDDFERLINLSEKYLSEAIDKTNHSTVLILAITGGFSKAEIYQYQHQYDSAVAEYKRILSHFKEKNTFKEYSKYAYLALDRISQIHLIYGNIEGYNEAVNELIKTYPDYYRTPIIKFEREAVNILNKNSICSDYARGSYESPARLLEYIKNGDVKELTQRIQTFLDALSKEYQGTYGGRMLGYHYAWLLDTTGQKKAAIDVMNVVNKETVTGYFHNPAINFITSILGDYSQLHQALILGEMGDYENALDIARSVKVDPNNNHLSNLVDSIIKGLEILKREVHKNGNNQ